MPINYYKITSKEPITTRMISRGIKEELHRKGLPENVEVRTISKDAYTQAIKVNRFIKAFKEL